MQESLILQHGLKSSLEVCGFSDVLDDRDRMVLHAGCRRQEIEIIRDCDPMSAGYFEHFVLDAAVEGDACDGG